ncbi:hypothetical protein F5Y00DRAFT_248316 [Daldinia vernicosa]|uniref:uncharacterized protein n=1 Tax=Daldinia vernicosa TaxID=114800 RepID=UPI0020083B88|nr:uncharacterized protein F5Y00DRAFT_248316 [Daldinia vernicosa]KAI0844571.1 hypothetical protein F5Y00DRAFT_248316 [Daldinia vernicosa]
MALDEHKVAEGLKDLRTIYPTDEFSQDYMLRVQVPTLYNPKNVAGIPEGDQVDSTGLDALLMVIRRIISQLPMEYRDTKDEAMGWREQANPLRRLAMADLVSTDKDILQAAKYHALKAFYPGGSLEGKDLSFQALAEHKLMQETFWQLDPFLLFNPYTTFKLNGVWEVGTLKINDSLSEDSLITFKTGSLGEQIAKKFGTFMTDDGIVFTKQANLPTILRVQYDVSAADPKKFQDLRKIVVDMRRLERRPDGIWKFTEPGAALKTYRLIAEVCLSSSADASDTIRMYDAEGEVIPIPTTFPNHQREPLGKENARYMLYYCYGLKDIPGEESYSEILPPFDEEKADLLQNILDRTTTKSH